MDHGDPDQLERWGEQVAWMEPPRAGLEGPRESRGGGIRDQLESIPGFRAPGFDGG